MTEENLATPFYFKLDEQKNPVPATRLEAEHLFKNDFLRRVGLNYVGDVQVSTVFLVLNHNFIGDDRRPILFETMIFGGEHSSYQARWYTWTEACEGHLKAVDMVRGKN